MREEEIKVNTYKNQSYSLASLQRRPFKLISFKLGRESYVVDILEIKEIRKSSNFTKVPNTKNYVVGLENLRGNIIPILDLRIMFDLNIERKNEENILIAKYNDSLVGLIVDEVKSIFNVGLEQIKESYSFPLSSLIFKYTRGVVSYNFKDYILLDLESILKHNSREEIKNSNFIRETFHIVHPHEVLEENSLNEDLSSNKDLLNYINEKNEEYGFHSKKPKESEESTSLIKDSEDEHLAEKLREHLKSKGFYPHSLNNKFLISIVKMLEFSSNAIEANSYKNFLSEFYSNFHLELWDDNYIRIFIKEVVEKFLIKQESYLNVLHLGCFDGLETLSLACALNESLEVNFKIIAISDDLLKIAQTSNLKFSEEEINKSVFYRENAYKLENNLYKFDKKLLDKILFEYAPLNEFNIPYDISLIFMRDVLSFFDIENQNKILNSLYKISNSQAILILGDNEIIRDNEHWVKQESNIFNIYKKV